MTTSPSPAGAGLPSPLEELDAVADDIFARWDRDMRSGKLLAALSGRVSNYDPRVTRVREALARLATTEAENARLRAALEPFVFGDPTLERILYDGMPDDAPCTFTIKLGDVRRARAALAASSKEATDEQA